MKQVIVNGRKGKTTSVIPMKNGNFSVWFDDEPTKPIFIKKELVQFVAEEMKVFKFYCGELYYAFAAKTKELAIAQFEEETGDKFTVCEEIPEHEWNKKMINIWEDNDMSKKPDKVSIREIMCGTEPQMIFTNDTASF